MRAMCSESSRPIGFHDAPASVVLYTPVPTETLLRIHASPVPTHTLSCFDGSTARAPMDCVYSSKTGLKVVPSSVDFQTPPLAAPTHTVAGAPPAPSMAAMRPPIAAGPIERACRPPRVEESSLTASSANRGSASAANSAASVILSREDGEGSLIIILLLFLLRFGLRLFLLHLGHLEDGVVDLGVDLVFLDRDRLPLPFRRAFAVALHGVRVHHAIDFLVVADDALGLHFLSLDLALAFSLDDEVGVGVEVVDRLVAVLGGDLQLVRRRAFHLDLAEVLDGVALGLRVDERAVE